MKIYNICKYFCQIDEKIFDNMLYKALNWYMNEIFFRKHVLLQVVIIIFLKRSYGSFQCYAELSAGIQTGELLISMVPERSNSMVICILSLRIQIRA